MKNLILATATFLLMLNTGITAATEPGRPVNENTYCAEMKNDTLVIMRDGEVLTHDIVFENGVELKSDGRVIYPNGLKATMKAGECVDKSGLINSPSKEVKE